MADMIIISPPNRREAMAELLAMYFALYFSVMYLSDQLPDSRIPSKRQALHGNPFHEIAGSLKDTLYQISVLGKK
jgi:hypothetical protein